MKKANSSTGTRPVVFLADSNKVVHYNFYYSELLAFVDRIAIQ